MIIKGKPIFNIFRNPSDFGFGMHIGMDFRDVGGYLSVAKPLVFEDIHPGTAIESPTVIGPMEILNALMDTLWAFGVRPSNGEGNVGQIGAIGSHLEDMRAIVANRLSVRLKGVA